MSPDKIAHMANQIGHFFVAQKTDVAVAGIENHILKFWDKRMRKALVDNLDSVQLDPAVRQAAERVRDRQPA
jgi:formate dehydrogenase subunit delta